MGIARLPTFFNYIYRWK